MAPPTTGRWRSARAGAFALLAAQISVTGHVIAGGTLPDLSLVLAMTALLAACLSGLARQRRGFGSLLAMMAGTQVVFHLLLTLGATQHPMAQSDSHPARMWVFHAVAALLSAALLAHGEQLLFALHGWLHRLRPTLPQRPRPLLRLSWTAVVDHQSVPLAERLIGAAVSRRGPPELVLSRP